MGSLFGALGALLPLLGSFQERGDLPGLVIISFATWSVVAWAIAQAVHEVEEDEGV